MSGRCLRRSRSLFRYGGSRHYGGLRRHRHRDEFLVRRAAQEILTLEAENVIPSLHGIEHEHKAGGFIASRLIENTVLAVSLSEIGPTGPIKRHFNPRTELHGDVARYIGLSFGRGIDDGSR